MAGAHLRLPGTSEGSDGWVWVNRGAIDAEPKSLLGLGTSEAIPEPGFACLGDGFLVAATQGQGKARPPAG